MVQRRTCATRDAVRCLVTAVATAEAAVAAKAKAKAVQAMRSAADADARRSSSNSGNSSSNSGRGNGDSSKFLFFALLTLAVVVVASPRRGAGDNNVAFGGGDADNAVFGGVVCGNEITMVALTARTRRAAPAGGAVVCDEGPAADDSEVQRFYS